MSLWAPREVLTGSPPSVKPRASAWQPLCTHPARGAQVCRGKEKSCFQGLPFTKEAVTKGAILIGSSRDFEGRCKDSPWIQLSDQKEGFWKKKSVAWQLLGGQLLWDPGSWHPVVRTSFGLKESRVPLIYEANQSFIRPPNTRGWVTRALFYKVHLLNKLKLIACPWFFQLISY